MLTVKSIGSEKVLQQLTLLTLPDRKRRRILRGAGRIVRRESRKRLREQRDLQGRRFQQRADGKKARMLRKLGKHLQVHTNANNAKVTFASNLVGKIASAHQHGHSFEKTAKDMAARDKESTGLATRRQAIALREVGYKIRRAKGKGWKKPSLKWITQNLSKAQAGLVLRILKDDNKQRWKIEIPQRSFLGQDTGEQKAMKNYMLSEATRLA